MNIVLTVKTLNIQEGYKCLIMAEGAQKMGEFSCYFSNPPAQRLLLSSLIQKQIQRTTESEASRLVYTKLAWEGDRLHCAPRAKKKQSQMSYLGKFFCSLNSPKSSRWRGVKARKRERGSFSQTKWASKFSQTSSELHEVIHHKLRSTSLRHQTLTEEWSPDF